LPVNFAHVHDVQQLVDQLAEAAKQDQLLVVDFFAPWCAACKALFPKLKKICVENPDVRFVAINFDEGKSICRQLGVKVLPYFQFYRGAEGRVAGFPASISKVAKIKEAIADFKSERCFLEEVPAAPLAEYPDVLPTSNGIIVANGVKAGSEDESEEPRKAELVV
jgi:thioredoxin-like negative regulator of GroEL